MQSEMCFWAIFVHHFPIKYNNSFSISNFELSVFQKNTLYLSYIHRLILLIPFDWFIVFGKSITSLFIDFRKREQM